MEALGALPSVPRLQGAIGELVAADFGEQEDIHVPLIEWESVAAQQSQEVELGSKSPDSLTPIENSNLELGDTEIVSNQQRRRLLKAHGKGKRGRTRKDGGKGGSFTNETLTNSDFVARHTALLREVEATGKRFTWFGFGNRYIVAM
ncbi:hypothetical protein V6N13_109106 [Hibiscus sabdariffa]